jgi:hypothetical protein
MRTRVQGRQHAASRDWYGNRLISSIEAQLSKTLVTRLVGVPFSLLRKYWSGRLCVVKKGNGLCPLSSLLVFSTARLVFLGAWFTCLSPRRLETWGGQMQTGLGVLLWRFVRCATQICVVVVVVDWWCWLMFVGVGVFGRRLSVCWSLSGGGVGLRTLGRLQAVRMVCCWMILWCFASVIDGPKSC